MKTGTLVLLGVGGYLLYQHSKATAEPHIAHPNPLGDLLGRLGLSPQVTHAVSPITGALAPLVPVAAGGLAAAIRSWFEPTSADNPSPGQQYASPVGPVNQADLSHVPQWGDMGGPDYVSSTNGTAPPDNYWT